MEKNNDTPTKNRISELASIGFGCVGLVGVLATVITLYVTLIRPAQVITIIEKVASITQTPQVIYITTEASIVESLNPTFTPTLTHTISPTNKPEPTSTPEPTITPTTAPTKTATTLLFEDDFDGGSYSVNWNVENAKVAVLNNELVAIEVSLLTVGEPEWTNYEVSFDMTADYMARGNYIGIRAKDTGNMILMHYGFHGAEWFVMEGGKKTCNSSFHTGLVEWN